MLGSILGTLTATSIKDGIAGLDPADQAEAIKVLGTGTIPHIADLSGAIRTVVESAYGSGVGHVFLYSAPLTLLTLVMVLLLPNKPLGTKNAVQLKNEESGSAIAQDRLIESSAAAVAIAPVGEVNPTGAIDLPERHGEPRVPSGSGR